MPHLLKFLFCQIQYFCIIQCIQIIASLYKYSFLLATPIPVKYESGTDIAIAHGHDITKNVSPRCIASSIGILNIIGKQITIRSANIITIGVYILLILETIVSVFVFYL